MDIGTASQFGVAVIATLGGLASAVWQFAKLYALHEKQALQISNLQKRCDRLED